MKSLITTAAASLLFVTSSHADTLFADSFDRADGTDLNAATTGKSGSLGALTWLERVGGDGGDALISSNTLRLGENNTQGGNNGFATAYLDHNFIDAAITSGGEFTVSVDLVGPIASGGNTRFTGFSVGNSLANVQNWNSNNPASGGGFPSDFFFGYDATAPLEVKIFLGSTQNYVQAIDLNTTGATLSVRFSGITDFDMGSTVNFEAFIDATSIRTGSFAWSGTNENYLNVYSNYTDKSGTLDNFAVTTITGPSSAALIGLAIMENPAGSGNYDFEWTSQTGKTYDLVSATDLSTAPSTWAVWDGQSDLAATPPTNSLTAIPGGGDSKRFFVVIEKTP